MGRQSLAREISQNVGNHRIIQGAIQAIFYLTIKSSNKTADGLHQNCPKGSNWKWHQFLYTRQLFLHV